MTEHPSKESIVSHRLTVLLACVLTASLPGRLPAADTTDPYLWLIEGTRPGEGVIAKPQDYIQDEFNFANLFVTAEEGAVVVAPCDAEIKSEGYMYRPALLSMQSFGYRGEDTVIDDVPAYDAEARKEMAVHLSERFGRTVDPRFVSYHLGLDCGDGEVLYLSGLLPLRYFATGTKIRRGDPLGTVGYAYKAVTQRSLCLERSVDGKAADPLSIFGLPTSYLPPEADTTDYLVHEHPVADLLADLAVLRSALEEGHPGLHDYLDRASWNALLDDMAAHVHEPMTSMEFMLLLQEAVTAVRDSHTALYPKRFRAFSGTYPPVLYGVEGTSVKIFSAFPDHQDLLGKTITRINGRHVAELIPQAAMLATRQDGFIESVTDLSLMKYFWLYCAQILNLGEGDELHLVFADGTEARLQHQRLTENIYQPKAKRFSPADGRYTTRLLDERTALLDINTFELLETDEQEIAAFVRAAGDSGRTNLVIDLRDNFGGSDEVLGRLFALFADRPFRTQATALVRDNDTYALFANTDNYSAANRNMFPEFTEPCADGYRQSASTYVDLAPNPEVHYAGDLYVLVNPRSISAATIFPALVRRFDRGVIVGQETGSCYYRMNAMKFAHVRLEHTGLELRMPLMRLVFDEELRADIPWGRGVIPDHALPLVHEFEGDEDPALAKVQELITAVR
ncbi:MAG: hypothetical protein GY838_07745 [bacterium]|nr:hypothetical protein [bacterium]